MGLAMRKGDGRESNKDTALMCPHRNKPSEHLVAVTIGPIPHCLECRARQEHPAGRAVLYCLASTLNVRFRAEAPVTIL